MIKAMKMLVMPFLSKQHPDARGNIWGTRSYTISGVLTFKLHSRGEKHPIY